MRQESESDEVEGDSSWSLESPGVDSPVESGPAAAEGSSVSREAAKGVMWLTAQTWLARAGGLVTIVILTHLLAPEAFGLLAVATTLLTLTYILSDLGLSTYVVQAATVDRRSLSTAFWVSNLGGVLLGLAIMFGATPLAALLRVPESAPILRAMTIIVILISLTSVPLALLRRRMAFPLLAIQGSVSALVAQIAALLAALGGLGVWALVLQLVVGQVIASVWIWVSARWRPTIDFSRTEFVVMARFGVKVVGTGLVSVGRAWAETGVIVACLGVRDLGYLSIAQRLVQTATELSGSAILPVAIVAFAKVKSSKERLRAAHSKATAVSQTIVTPIMVFIAVCAPVLVPFLFGQEWTVSAQVAQLLAISAALSFGTSLDRGMFEGLGRPGRWFALVTAVYTLSVVLISLAVRQGLLVVAFAYVITSTIETLGRWTVVSRFLEVSVARTARPFLRIAPAAFAAALAGAGSLWLLRDAPALVSLAVAGVLVLGVYVVMIRLIIPGTWTDLVGLLPGRRRTGEVEASKPPSAPSATATTTPPPKP